MPRVAGISASAIPRCANVHGVSMDQVIVKTTFPRDLGAKLLSAGIVGMLVP